MFVKNFTPHTITFLNDRNEVILEVPSSGIARAAQSRTSVGAINGIPVNKSSFGRVENLPEPEEGVILVVSALTAQACPERNDVYITDDAVRDETGRIIGCRALAHV